MFDTVSNDEGTQSGAPDPTKEQPKQMSVSLRKLINDAHEIGYRKGYSEGHKAGSDKAHELRTK